MAKFELTLNVMERDGGLLFGFEYNTDLFERKTIERLGQHLLCLLDGIVANPQSRLGELGMLSAPEQHYLLDTLNDNRVDYPQNLCIHELFEQQVKDTPDLTAVIEGEQSLSYCSLNEKANQLAHYLRNEGVTTDTLVGICAERSLDLMIGLLAILKAGGAYVPLDPNYPQNRLDYMVKDSGITLLLTQKDIQDKGLGYGSSDLPKLDSQGSDNLAYVIYTSGSTGQPKGVMNEHRALANLCFWHINQYAIGQNTRATHLASIGFDAAVWEIWPYLLSGGAIVMVSDAVRQSPIELVELLDQHQVSHSFIPTALLEAMGPAALNQSSLQVILTGGQKLSNITLDVSGPKLVNHYGPTEAAVVSTFYPLPLKLTDTPPIGRPIDNVEIYVLSPDRALVPQGSIGELYVGGVSVARGYLNRDELTAEAFIQNPFSEAALVDGAGKRLYKTGDLVSYLPDGNIEFIGRSDDQLKIRGFRIELGEIEHQLSILAGVKNCVVVARQDPWRDQPGLKLLVAYVVGQADSNVLSEGLNKTLPDYMVPSLFVMLDQLPLTANGKVDKKALPAPDASVAAGQYVAPTTATQIKLVQIFATLLK
ncbi:MAG: amino acid adenylation domain-containing protein, partial [Psychrosphaera sp.]|nr:amino acid adenylation domain-containing protein [Psychrosphaera sp.]